jgi:hypothetical protein
MSMYRNPQPSLSFTAIFINMDTLVSLFTNLPGSSFFFLHVCYMSYPSERLPPNYPNNITSLSSHIKFCGIYKRKI